jgi:hypothetical protein
LHSETLKLDLHLYPDRRFRFYDPMSHQMLRSHGESERERSREQQARLSAEAKAQRLAERLKALGINPDDV